jgi:hypothetical protein
MDIHTLVDKLFGRMEICQPPHCKGDSVIIINDWKKRRRGKLATVTKIGKKTVWIKIQGESKAIKKTCRSIQLHENNKFLDLFDQKDILSVLSMWMDVQSTLALVDTCQKLKQKQDELCHAKLRGYGIGFCSNKKMVLKKIFRLSLLADSLQKHSESIGGLSGSRTGYTGGFHKFYFKFIYDDKETYSYSDPVFGVDFEGFALPFTYLPFRGETPPIKKWESLMKYEQWQKHDAPVETIPEDPVMGVKILITACGWHNLDPSPQDLKVVAISNYEHGDEESQEHPIRSKFQGVFRSQDIPCEDLTIWWSLLGNNLDWNYHEIGFVTNSTTITGVCFHHGQLDRIGHF